MAAWQHSRAVHFAESRRPIFSGAAFNFGNPVRLFDASPYNVAGVIGRTVDVSPDGKRFLIIKSVKPEESTAQINVVLNWIEDLKQKVPVN